MTPVSPVLPGHEEQELSIAEQQPEYNTLPALSFPGGILTRWRFEAGEGELFAAAGTVRLVVLHGAGGKPYRHRMDADSGETCGLSERVEDASDPRFTVFAWRPDELNVAAVVRQGYVFLRQWNEGRPVQPLIMSVCGLAEALETGSAALAALDATP